MITAAQRELLDALYGYDATQETSDPEDGPIGEEGSEIGTIVENTLIPLQQTVLYLSKAITEDCQTFLLSLDRLYAHCQATNQAAAMELIQALKRLNDVCFNHNMQDRRADGNDYGALPTLQQLFGRLTDQQGLGDRRAQISVDDARLFREAMIQYVQAAIARIQAHQADLTVLHVETQLPSEPNSAWRAVVGLPRDQMPRAPVHPRLRVPPLQAPQPRAPRPIGDPVPNDPFVQIMDYASSMSASHVISDVYRNTAGDLFYEFNGVEIPDYTPGMSHEEALAFRFVRHVGTEREGLIVTPRMPGSTMTLLGEYCQQADQEDQAKLARTAVNFLRNLTAWETSGNRQRHLDIEPRFLIIEKDGAGEITLNRIGFEKTIAFIQRDAGLTMGPANQFGSIFCDPVRARGQYSRSSSAFSLGASLFVACFTQEEFFRGLTTHLGHDAQSAHVFELLMNPFIPSATMEAMIREKCTSGQLHEDLANILRATLVSDPSLRTQNIAELLARPSEQPRPGLHM